MIRLRIFPPNPIHGQSFTDVYNIVWTFDAIEGGWIKIGPTLNIPVAKAGVPCKE